MSRNFRLWQDGHIVSLLAPATDAAGRTSAYVSLRNAHKAYLLVHLDQANSATVALTPLQASSASAGDSKALTHAVPIVADLDTATSDVLVVKTDAVSYTTDAATKHKVVIFEIDPIKAMDVNNDFTHIAISTGASSASNITSAMLVLLPMRNMSNPQESTTGV